MTDKDREKMLEQRREVQRTALLRKIREDERKRLSECITRLTRCGSTTENKSD